MKKIFSVILCAVIFALPLCAVSCFAAGKSFVVIGDSIAEGVGSNDPAVDSYAAIVAEKNGYELTNIARAGSTSLDLLNKVKLNKDAREAIKNADIIEISIGGNDFLLNNMLLTIAGASRGDFSRVEEILVSFRKNFDKIITEIKALNPTALVVVQTLYNPMGGTELFDAYEAALEMLNGVYVDYLSENPGSYIITDVHGAFAGKNGLIYKDNIHPSPEGHTVIADTLLKTLARGKTDLSIPQTGGAVSGIAFLLAAASLAGIAVTRKKK